MMQRSWLWPTVIILSALVAGLTNFVLPDLIGRPIIVMWFLFFCPGMMLIRFFQLKEPITEWTLAIALSLSIDAIVAGLLMYSGHWSPPMTLIIIIGICFIGEITRVAWATMKRMEIVS